MRLGVVLLRKRLPPGNIWGGKHRMRLIPEPHHINQLAKRFAVEEQNMLYLRNPYLTLEQATGYAKELKKHDKWLAETIEKSVRPYKPSVTLDERLAALNNANSWD